MPISSKVVYQLEKSVWTHDDFDRMGWHDAVIHAITFQPEAYEFILDIDYILAWVEPEPPSIGYSFWVSPATLVFKNTNDFNADFSDPLGLQIMDITRKDARPPKNVEYIDLKTEWTWTIDLQQGEFTFSAAGYSQFIRRQPVRISSQQFSLEERGGISSRDLERARGAGQPARLAVNQPRVGQQAYPGFAFPSAQP